VRHRVADGYGIRPHVSRGSFRSNEVWSITNGCVRAIPLSGVTLRKLCEERQPDKIAHQRRRPTDRPPRGFGRGGRSGDAAP
jgi:hypothetical protein